MANRQRDSDADSHRSASRTTLRSESSLQPVTVEQQEAEDVASDSDMVPLEEEDTTYFLLDIASDNEDARDNESVSSDTSSDSTSSSVSAQVVVDHGHSLPRRLKKSGARHLLRSGDDESESDYAYSVTPGRGDARSSPDRHTQRFPVYHEAVPYPTNSITADRHDFVYQPTSDTEYDEESQRWQRKLSDETSKSPALGTSSSMAIYTDEHDDLMEEMPAWDQEHVRRTSERADEHDYGEGEPVDVSYIRSPQRSKPDKRIQRMLQANLQSHSWSRRESLKSNRDPGLTSEQALSKLLQVANQIVDEERVRVEKRLNTRAWLLRKETLLSLFCAFTLLAFYIAGYEKSDPYQFRLTGALVEALLILAMIGWNGYLYRREHLLTCREMADRATTIISTLERSGMNMVQDTKIPFIPSMSVAKVVRDGVVRTFPVNLLVDGDVVEMLYGDVAPGRMKYLQKPAPPDTMPPNDVDTKHDDPNATGLADEAPPQTREYYLAKDQTFKPSFFGIPPPPGLMDEYLRARGRHQFALLETPLEKNMRAAFLQQRPTTVFANETLVIVKVYYQYIVWIVLAIAFVVNLLRFGLRDFTIDKFSTDQLVEEVFTLPVLCVLPLLPLCLPSLWLIARSFGNAQLLILFEALQISKTEYEDDDEVDEFDAEAPPPTKDLELSPNAVWDRFCALLTKWDRLSLTRSTNLLESLGSTTVICCLDREGTIANPFPTVEQLMFPNSEEDISCLDLEEDEDEPFGYKFEDQDWEHSLPCLKPVGLNFMLNTNCGVIQGRKRSDYHRRRSKLHVYGKTSPARQTCLCRLGKCIGFQDEALQSFALRAEIYAFAPYHDILNTPRYEFSQYFQFEVPNALSTVFEEKTSGSYQLLTDGHPTLVMDKCSDYWDGRALQTMSSQMEKKINDFFQNALVHDMQCIAYAYRPVNTANNSRIPFLNPSDSGEEDPGCAFVVLPYKPPSSDSSDSSDSSSAISLDDSAPVSQKLPVNPALQEQESVVQDHDLSKKSQKTGATRRRRRKSNRTDDTSSSSGPDNDDNTTDYSFEEDEPVDEQEEETFYKEVVKGQIFLGMTAMCHQPKQNVVDFIEDLGLAGIRFVYFSPTAERESKAFAERLGLETDWNSCILLSSTDDESCGNGYLQTHDIKAQLPRGIDQIRPHIENVDDIPLHVSLFAECTPRAMKEMIRVFQEYGEVVCCVGNALNVKNTESFALADISIAMEPMHTRAQSKGRLSLSGRQPPLAVGASFVSLPCGLFMQYETSLYAVTQLIRDARRLLNCVRMGFAFYAAVCMSMTLIQLLTFCMLLPPVLTGYQILWIMWIILPVLTISMLFTPHEDNTMLLMPGKNADHLTDLRRFMTYYVLRFILPILMCIVIYILTLINVLDLSANQVFGGYGDGGWLHWTREEQWAVLYAQNFMLVAFVWYLACISLSFLHRTSSLREFVPFRNKVWVLAFFISIALQFCFCAVSLAHGPFLLKKVPWFVYLLIFAWPIVLVPVQELVKMHDDKEFTRFQKRSKLEFSTKLGMHSPL